MTDFDCAGMGRTRWRSLLRKGLVQGRSIRSLLCSMDRKSSLLHLSSRLYARYTFADSLRVQAKSLVAAGLAERVLVQLSYAIGVAEPLSICTFALARILIEPALIARCSRRLVRNWKDWLHRRRSQQDHSQELRSPTWCVSSSVCHHSVCADFVLMGAGMIVKELGLQRPIYAKTAC